MAILRTCIVLILCAVWPHIAHGERLKDIADVEGVRPNQLFGYGIIIGLNGTGDGNSSRFTMRSLANLLEKLGVRVGADEIKVKNVASVIVTANLPPFVRPGTKIDITLSSLGDAKSLQGGTLLLTSLRGADGNVYAVAQGAITVGGFAVEGGGDTAQKNHPTVATIAEGAIVERSIPFDLFQSKRVRIVLRNPDFTTMTRVVTEINRSFGTPLAVALDSASVEVPLMGAMARDPIGLVAQLENIDIMQDVGAKVVVNERTGTIIMGENVRVSTVALAHGNLSISIRSERQVSQPEPLSQGGETQVVTNTDLTVGEDKRSLNIITGQVNLGEVVSALNALGATPRDLISILTALKRAGALHAELVVM